MGQIVKGCGLQSPVVHSSILMPGCTSWQDCPHLLSAFPLSSFLLAPFLLPYLVHCVNLQGVHSCVGSRHHILSNDNSRSNLVQALSAVKTSEMDVLSVSACVQAGMLASPE